MKAHSVKSNAKRAARKFCADRAEFEAAEPVFINANGGGAWLPAVVLVSPIAAEALGEDEHGGVTVDDFVVVLPNDLLAGILYSGETMATLDAKGGEVAQAIGRGVRASDAPAEAEAPKRKPGRPAAPKAPKVSAEAMLAAAAALPPRKEYTPEEIAGLREARRARIEAAKAAAPATGKATKADTILSLIGAEGGATIRAICEAIGWQRHTLRGFIGGTLRKRGHNIVNTKINGEGGYIIAAQGDAQ